LIHLIRDLNDDVLKHPYDGELKRLALAFAVLLKPMVETVDRYIHAVQRRNHPPVGKFLYGFDLILGILTPCQRLLLRKSVRVRQVRPCRRRIRTGCLLPKRIVTIWAGEHRIVPQMPPS
jgi:hypothetical protein